MKKSEKTESERTIKIDQLNSFEKRDFRKMKGKQNFRPHNQDFLIVSPCQPDRKKESQNVYFTFLNKLKRQFCILSTFKVPVSPNIFLAPS